LHLLGRPNTVLASSAAERAGKRGLDAAAEFTADAVTMAGGKALVDAARAVERAVEEKLVAAEKLLEAGLMKVGNAVGEELSELEDKLQNELAAISGGLIDSSAEDRREALTQKYRDEESKAAAQRHLDDVITPQIKQLQDQLAMMPVHLIFHDPSGVDDFHFHVNEHSVEYMVTVVDAFDERSNAMGKAVISLEQIKNDHTFQEDWHDQEDSDEDKHKHKHKSGKGKGKKPKRKRKELMTPMALVLKDSDDRPIGTVDVEVMYREAEEVPDFHFLTEFTTDNNHLKPRCNSDCEGWVWMKGSHDHSFHQHWMWVTDSPKPAICYLDQIESEHELQKEYSHGHLGKRIVTINAADIYSVTNVAVETQNLHRKAHKHFHQFRAERDRRDLTIADCELEFTTLQKTADADHTVSHGFLHHKDHDERAGTLWVHVESARGVPVYYRYMYTNYYYCITNLHYYRKSVDRNGKADPYCRVAVDGARLHTHTVHDTLDPVWDEAFYMPVHGQASRVISDCHFAAHHNHFIPGLLSYLVAVFCKVIIEFIPTGEQA
jgi:hypothetical protein